MTIKKAVYKVDNGSGFDEIYFKTSSELVQVGANKTLDTRLNELNYKIVHEDKSGSFSPGNIERTIELGNDMKMFSTYLWMKNNETRTYTLPANTFKEFVLFPSICSAVNGGTSAYEDISTNNFVTVRAFDTSSITIANWDNTRGVWIFINMIGK